MSASPRQSKSDEGLTLETSALKSLYSGQFTFGYHPSIHILMNLFVCLYWLGALQKFVKDVNGEEESKPKHEEPSTLEEEEHETGYYKQLAPLNI